MQCYVNLLYVVWSFDIHIVNITFMGLSTQKVPCYYDLYLHIYEHLSIYLLDFIILTCMSEFSFYHYGFLIYTDLSSFKPIFVSFEIYV